MSNEVILNLSFDNQTVTDLTGNWTLDGTPNATYEQIDGRDGYSIVEGSLGRCIVLNAVDQNARYDEYTIDFDMFVKSTYTSNYYNYNVFYLWSQKNPNIRGSFVGKIGEVLSISPRIGSSSPMGVTSYSPIGRWVHVTITSGPTGENNLYYTAVYVDGIKLVERTESGSSYYGNPFGISQRIIPCARDPGSFLMPNGPGVCLNTYKIVTGIHVPNQNPAISLFNLSRVFNNFCTWLKRQLSTVAFTGSYNDLSNKPTISTVNDGTLTIQQNGTNVQTFTANASTNKTANIQCVDLSTAQTIGGVKTFSSNVIIQGSRKVTCNLDNSFIELDGGTTWGKGGSIVLSGQDRSSYTNSVLIVSKSDTNTDILQYQNGELKPHPNNTNNSSLGTSTSRWKSINGIAPDELGLPTSTYTDVSSYITNFDSTPNTFTAPVSGLLFLDGTNLNPSVECVITNNTKAYKMNVAYGFATLRGLFPVEKGDSINVYISQPITAVARIHHLKGKV